MDIGLSTTFHLWATVLSAGLLTACNSASNKSDLPAPVNQDHQTLTDPAPVDSLDDLVTLDPQTQLDDFLIAFSQYQQFPSVRYFSTYEYESSREVYYYKDSYLKACFVDHALEGGGGGHLRISYDTLLNGTPTQTILYTPYFESAYEKGFFCVHQENQAIYYEVSGQKDFLHPVIIGPIEAQDPEYPGTLDLNQIQTNTDKFALKSGFYAWDLRREKVESDYGIIEIYETIEVDQTLFESIFLSGQ